MVLQVVIMTFMLIGVRVPVLVLPTLDMISWHVYFDEYYYDNVGTVVVNLKATVLIFFLPVC